MQYSLTGFVHDLDFRVFSFEGTAGKERREYSIRADLVLARRYGIPTQELPLLCRQLLEELQADDVQRAFVYTEAAMQSRAGVRLALSESVRRGKLMRKKPNPIHAAAVTEVAHEPMASEHGETRILGAFIPV